MHKKIKKMHFRKIVKFLLMKLQSKPSGTSRYLEVAPIFNFLNANDFLGQDQTHINSHFDLDNFYQKGCTLIWARSKNEKKARKMKARQHGEKQHL